MKRASVSSHKKGRRPQVLSSSSNESPRRNQQFAAGSSSSEEDEKNIQKRARVIQQRMSVIQIEKLANRKGSNGGEKKRKSNQAGFSSGVSSEGDGSPDENSTNKPKILRRRLTKKFRQSHSSNDNNGRHNSISGRSSLASVLSLGNLSDVSVFGAKKAPTDQKTLRAIYSTCSALFQAHKITPQNAFSLKLVECLDEIIESDDFDRRNLPLLARTIEIGGKIYTCRVDCTHANTIKLVNELALNQNHPLLDEGQEDQAAQLEILQDVPEDEGNKKSAAKRKKRSRFIEENESKLNTGFEDQTAKYYLRRTDLKSKFHRNVEEESDFDYISYILKPGEANPFKSEGEREALGCKALIPDSHNDPDEMTTVPWLPFHALTEWDAKKFDLWGEPLPNSDALNVSEMQRPASPIAAANEVENEFAYNPENRPDEYPAAENDSLASFGDGFQDNFEEEKPTVNADGSVDRPLALDELRSLDDLRKFFGQLQRNEVQMKEKYGWAGPVFLKPQRPLAQKTIKVKKEKKKKAVLMLNFEDIDWKDKANRYQVVESSKTTLDDRTLEKWRKTKTTRPFSSSVNFMGWEEDEEEFRAPFDSNPAVDDPLANITRFFVDANRDIFQLMEGEFRAGNLNGAEEADSSGNGPFSSREWSPGDEMDLEAARDYPEEERALEIEQAVEQVDNLAGLDLSAMFPGTQALGTSLTGTSEIDAIRFARRPKPIDMHALKDLIRKILQENLKLDDEGKPSLPVETKFELKALISELMKRADGRMAKHLSVAIIVVGLMHVVAEKKLFMENGGDNPSVVCKGTEWRHKDNIPLGSIHPME